MGYLLAFTHHAPGMTHDLWGILISLSPCASADRHAGAALHRQCSGAGDGGGRGGPGGLVAAARGGGGGVWAGLDRAFRGGGQPARNVRAPGLVPPERLPDASAVADGPPWAAPGPGGRGAAMMAMVEDGRQKLLHDSIRLLVSVIPDHTASQRPYGVLRWRSGLAQSSGNRHAVTWIVSSRSCQLIASPG